MHEPNEGDGCIPVDMSKHKVFKEKFPAPEKKWDGGWYGDETSRIEYLKQHGKDYCLNEWFDLHIAALRLVSRNT